MTGIRISEFETALGLSGTEVFPIIQNGENKITTLNSLSSVIVSTRTPVFITDVRNNTGLIQKVYETNTVPANSVIDYVMVDTGDSLTVTFQWDGPADEWTGYPMINEIEVPTSAIQQVGSSTRRFQASRTISLPGSAREITAEVGTGSHTISAVLLGDGPVITNATFSQPPTTGGYQPPFFMHGDPIQVTVEFDIDDVKSIQIYSGSNFITPNQTKNVTVTRTTPPSATFTTTVDTSSLTLKQLALNIDAKNAFGSRGPRYTSANTIDAKQGPDILNVTFGSYPGSQTELKNGDQIDVTFEVDTNNVNAIIFDGPNTYASGSSTKSVSIANRTGTVKMPIGYTLTQLKELPTKQQARSSYSKTGNWFISTNLLKVNNTYPTFSGWSVTYPSGQEALKQTETAGVNLTVSNQGLSPIYSYTTPRSEITIPANTTYTVGKTVTCTNPGTYNISTDNYKLTVTRTENDATASYSDVVWIADKQPVLSVTHNAGARMRSGGNAGTSPQQYTVTTNSDQQLKSFTMSPANGAGVFTSNSWSKNGTGTTWTMNKIEVHDDDPKGTHTWSGITAVNLSNMSKNSVDNGKTYIFGGFVTRTLVIGRLSRYGYIGTQVENTAKLTYSHSWPGSWSFDNSLANGAQLNKSIVPFTGTDIELKYTIVQDTNDQVVNRKGNTVFILDLEAVNANNNTISPAQIVISEVV